MGRFGGGADEEEREADVGATLQPSIYVTRPLPPPGITPLLDAGFAVDQHDDDALSRDDLLVAVKGRDGLLCMLTERIDAELMDAAGPGLRVVANLAVGFDNVDLEAATARGILVANTPDVLTEATADLAWTLLLAASRRVVEGDALARSGTWTGWRPTELLGVPVHGSTLGVLGLGKIGVATARRAAGFGMRVIYHNRSRNYRGEGVTGARYVELDELLATSDFLSLHAPLTDASRHLIDAAALDAMKPTAVLVNTGRGALVDEAALVDALRRGSIAAAGLDVFEHEPEISAELRALPNVVLLPHIGSATTTARAAMVELCCENIIAVLSGRRPPTALNREVLEPIVG
jgi:glyoxylate reductase